MQFGLNTISSPYSQGLAKNQINLQNQAQATNQQPNNKGSQKEIQLI